MSSGAKSFFTLIFFLTVIVIFAGGAIGETDLTPDTPPAPRSADSNYSAVQGVWSGGSICSGTYTVQAGDTLSKIARQCGIELNALIAANPGLGNPNVITPGQLIYIPGAASPNVPDSGGGLQGNTQAQSEPQNAAAPAPVGGIPSSGPEPGKWEVKVSGFPSHTDVTIGLGRVGEPPIPLATPYKTDSSGQFNEQIAIPADAREGEQWVVTITTAGEIPMIATSTPLTVNR